MRAPLENLPSPILSAASTHTRPSQPERLFRTVEHPCDDEYHLQWTDDLVVESPPKTLLSISYNEPSRAPEDAYEELYCFLASQIIAYEACVDSPFELPVHADLRGNADGFRLVIRSFDRAALYQLGPVDFTYNDAMKVAIEAVADAYEQPMKLYNEFGNHFPSIDYTDDNR